jgi:hypothetical protein
MLTRHRPLFHETTDTFGSALNRSSLVAPRSQLFSTVSEVFASMLKESATNGLLVLVIFARVGAAGGNIEPNPGQKLCKMHFLKGYAQKIHNTLGCDPVL